MKAIGLGLVVGGWVIAVGALLVSEANGVRLAAALAGLGTSLSGILTLNGAHVENAIWKARRH